METPFAASPFQSRRGRSLQLRPARPDDAPALAALIAGLSRRSVALRYLTPRTMPPELAWREAERLTAADGPLVLVVTAEGEGQIVGVGELARDRAEPGVAEGALVVADAYQGEGIGGALMGGLGAAAGRAAIGRIRAVVQSQNRPMRRLIAGLGRPYTSRFDGGEVYYEIPL